MLPVVYSARADAGRELRDGENESKAGFNATAAESLTKQYLQSASQQVQYRADAGVAATLFTSTKVITFGLLTLCKLAICVLLFMQSLN